jgi:hypothetical protein
MDRHNGHLRCVLIYVEAVRDQLRFAGTDEIHEPQDPCSQLFQRALSDIGMVDVHDGLRGADCSMAGHATSPSSRQAGIDFRRPQTI